MNNNVSNLIRDFALVNLERTKQHIYIFNLAQNTNGQNLNLNIFPYPILNQSTQVGVTKLIIAPTVDFNVILTNPFKQVILNFKQPIIVEIHNRHIIYYATILEKNMGSHFADNRAVIKVVKANDESLVIETINHHFINFNPSVCDLNRGIKHLWNDDKVDSKYAKWKKDSSTTTETMDENYTLKIQYPDIFQDLINSPLKKMIFKYLPDDELSPDHFTIDPSTGQISIPLYPKNENQNKYVVSEIISNN